MGGRVRCPAAPRELPEMQGGRRRRGSGSGHTGGTGSGREAEAGGSLRVRDPPGLQSELQAGWTARETRSTQNTQARDLAQHRSACLGGPRSRVRVPGPKTKTAEVLKIRPLYPQEGNVCATRPW